ADQFSASQTNENGITHDLRLLTRPLYRHASNDPNVSDGALFVFVQGTDPEAALLIEARLDERGQLAWQYALARMTFRKVTVSNGTAARAFRASGAHRGPRARGA